jgi:CRP-like cAMP-binding protein
MAHPFQNFIVSYHAGDCVFREGEAGATMYIVQSGRIRLFREMEGDRRPLGTLEKGDFFGEMSILEGLPRTVSAEVLEDTELIEINSTIFDKMIRGNIEIAVRMLRKLSIRLREAERRLAEVPAAAVKPQRTVAQPAARPVEAVTGGARLVATEGDGTYPLRDGETLVGRYDPVTDLRPDIDLTDLDIKRSVSRRHARIVRGSEGYTVVEEVGALNGTFVNGERLVTGQSHPIADGDRVGLGTVTLVFRTAPA